MWPSDKRVQVPSLTYGRVDGNDTEVDCKSIAIWTTGCKSQRAHEVFVMPP